MGNPPRTRKRVHALRRAPDGSAFQKCKCCESMVPIALFDMHGCAAKGKLRLKRFKGVCEKPNFVKQGAYSDQVRSPFRLFMERFVETCSSGDWLDIDRKGFHTWKGMSKKERQPFIIQAGRIDAAHRRALHEEVGNTLKFADDEADSAMVGKYDKSFASKTLTGSDDSGWFESLNTYDL